ncbi:MAG: hypothetical protein Q7U10_07305 [Thermodesulfovibrionia bacterium]|nr:hypothetical protein [Thermodesulfovibrionia bacterium]
MKSCGHSKARSKNILSISKDIGLYFLAISLTFSLKGYLLGQKLNYFLSPGIQIHNTTYSNNPAPKASIENKNPALHIQDGIGVASPNPPHTPPIKRSVEDLFAIFKFSQTPISSSYVLPRLLSF